MEKLKQLIEEIIKELETKRNDGIIEENNFQLLCKLLKKADSEEEAMSIGTLGTTFKRTEFKFDEKLEIFDNRIKYLKKRKDLSFGESKNKLIIGENYYSLLNLLVSYQKKIDVIYIDPPYGSNDLGQFAETNYINKINRNNLLSSLKPRLFMAKLLLSNDGLIFCSIDDKNQACIKLLFDDVFGEENFIACLPRLVKKGGKSSGLIAKNSDYILIYSKNKKNADLNRILHDDPGFNKKDKFFEKRGYYKLNQCLDYDSLQYNKSMDYAFEFNGEVFYAGGNKEDWEKRQQNIHNNHDWVWRWSKPKLKFGIENDFIEIKETKNGKRIYTKTYLNCEILKTENGYEINYKKRDKTYDSLFFVNNNFSNDRGKKELDSFQIENTFNYPKPVNLIKECIKMAPKSQIILDFYAGSGTTGEAVLALNKEDGGNRNFILCTNNEKDKKMHPNGIAIDITLERLRIISTGKNSNGEINDKWIQKHYNSGLEVYDIDFVQDNDPKVFELIEPINYGITNIKGIKDKVEWITKNFKKTTKELK